jgi:O-antigen ligase
VPFQLAKHFFRQEAAEELGSIGGLEISVANISLALLYLGWLMKGRQPVLRLTVPRRVTLPAVFLVTTYVFSIFAANNVTLSIFEVWTVLELFLLYWYIANTVISREDVLFIVRFLLAGLIIEDFLMLAQVFGFVGDFNFWGIRAQADFIGTGRISGTLGAPNGAAAYLAMGIVLSLSVLLAEVKRLDKCLAAFAATLATIPLVATLSRGGWLALGVGATAFAMFRGRRFRLRSAAGALTVILLLTGPFADRIRDRVSEDDNGAAASRVPLNKMAALMIYDHPLSGVGANNFPVAMGAYVSRGFLGEFLYTVHDKYLLVWAEVGTGGIVAFIWLLVAIACEGFLCRRRADPLLSPLALGITAAIIGLTSHMLFDVFREGPAYRLLWLGGGLITAMNRIAPLCSPIHRSSETASEMASVVLN